MKKMVVGQDAGGQARIHGESPLVKVVCNPGPTTSVGDLTQTEQSDRIETWALSQGSVDFLSPAFIASRQKSFSFLKVVCWILW